MSSWALPAVRGRLRSFHLRAAPGRPLIFFGPATMRQRVQGEASRALYRAGLASGALRRGRTIRVAEIWCTSLTCENCGGELWAPARPKRKLARNHWPRCGSDWNLVMGSRARTSRACLCGARCARLGLDIGSRDATARASGQRSRALRAL